MLDQTKATVDHRRGPRQRGIIGALTTAELGSGMDRRWTPRIIVLSGLVLAILCDAFVAQILSVNYWETYRATEAANGDLARALEEYMLRNMQGVDLLLSTTIEALEQKPSLLSAGNPALINELKRRVAPYPTAKSIVVLDADGNMLGDALGNEASGRPANFADRAYYKVQRDDPGRGLFIDVPLTSRVPPKGRFIAVSRALLAADRSFGGIVFVALDYHILQQFFLSLDVGQRGTVTLYRDDGKILLRAPNADEFAGRDVRSTLLFTRYLPQAPSGSFKGRGILDGTSRSISYRRVAGMSLVVSVARDPVEFLAGWKNNALYYSLIAAGLNLLIVGFGLGLARQWRLRAKSEQALRDNLEQHQLVTENVPALIVHVGADGHIRYANRVALEWYALPSAEAIGSRKIDDFIDPLRLGEARLKIEAALAGRTTRGEEKAAFPDGCERWCETIRVPDCGHDGTVRGYFVLSVDITERKRIEDELHQARKMEAIGQLTGGVAHDFNNILTVITGTIEILGDAVKDRPHLAQIANMISAAAARGADLTKHLLAFSRRQPLQPRSTDVNALLIDAARLLRPTLGEDIEIESMLAHDLAPALIDPSQLSTAILNLALNARDAMPSGGKLTLETRNVVLDEHYARHNIEVRPGYYVMIAVSDTGVGIPGKLLDKVFEPFFTTKDAGKGSGLGLSMVYGFVKQSDGHIKIYSEEGHGTSVKLYLPRAAGAPEALTADTGISGSAQGDEFILLVEDDALVREYVMTQISRFGYHTQSASNAAEALAIIDRGERIDLLFTDVMLPGGMNGRQLATEAQKRRPGLKVLYTSGYTENVLVHHGRLDPGVLLLPKPYLSSDLARMLRTALTS
jgi:PAS domain S-box-containing protein